LQDGVADFQPAAFIPESRWALNGKWKIEPEKIVSQASGAKLLFNIKSEKVYLVMGTADGTPQKISLKLNGEPIGEAAGKDVQSDTVTVNGHALYELVSQKTFQNSLLEITAQTPGIELYAFTFGK
jgi:Thioredoxin like C-terminal domain